MSQIEKFVVCHVNKRLFSTYSQNSRHSAQYKTLFMYLCSLVVHIIHVSYILHRISIYVFVT